MLKLVLLENTRSQMTNIPETPHFQEITEPCRESFLSVTAAKAGIQERQLLLMLLFMGLFASESYKCKKTLLSCLQSHAEELSQPEGLI